MVLTRDSTPSTCRGAPHFSLGFRPGLIGVCACPYDVRLVAVEIYGVDFCFR